MPFLCTQREASPSATFHCDGPPQASAPHVLHVTLRFLDEESGFLPDADDVEASLGASTLQAFDLPVPPAQAAAALRNGTVTMLFNCSACGDGPCHPFGGDAAAGGAVWRIAAEHEETVRPTSLGEGAGPLLALTLVWLLAGDGAGRVHTKHCVGLASGLQQRVRRVERRRVRHGGGPPAAHLCEGAAPGQAAVPTPRGHVRGTGTGCDSRRRACTRR